MQGSLCRRRRVGLRHLVGAISRLVTIAFRVTIALDSLLLSRRRRFFLCRSGSRRRLVGGDRRWRCYRRNLKIIDHLLNTGHGGGVAGGCISLSVVAQRIHLV